MSSPASPEKHPNRLIAGLPLGMQRGFIAKMDLVQLTKQQIIYEQGESITHVYFPCSAVISLIVVMENGAGVEVATVGNDGFLGIPRYFGVEFAFARGIVQIPGALGLIPTGDRRQRKSKRAASTLCERAARSVGQDCTL